MLTNSDFLKASKEGEVIRNKAFFIDKENVMDFYSGDIQHCTFFFSGDKDKYHLDFDNAKGNGVLMFCNLINVSITPRKYLPEYFANVDNMSEEDKEFITSLAIFDGILGSVDFIRIAEHHTKIKNKVFLLDTAVAMHNGMGAVSDCVFLSKHTGLYCKDAELTDSVVLDLFTIKTELIVKWLKFKTTTTDEEIDYIKKLSIECLEEERNRVTPHIVIDAPNIVIGNPPKIK